MVAADGCEMMLKSSKAVQQLARENRSLAERIGQWIKDFVRRLKRAFKGVEARHEEARILMRHAEDMQKMWDRALVQAVYNRDAQSSKKAATEGGGVKYSIEEIENSGKYYVQADRQVLSGNNSEEWSKQIENYINEVIRKEQDIAIPTSDGHVLLLTGRSAYKLSDRHVAAIEKKIEALIDDDNFALKGRVSTHIDELIQVARFDTYQTDINKKHENDIGEDGFNYYQAFFRDFDGQYYLIRFSSGINQAEETVYSVGRIWKRRFPAGGGSSSTREALKNGKKPSETIIRTSEAKSQEIKTAIQIAYEKALKEKNKVKKSLWDECVSDRELLLDAATEKNASEAVLAYARKYKAYEGLLRREERLRARLEASRAAEQKQTGPADNGATEIEEKLRKCREDIARAEERLARLESGVELRREADKAREKWFSRNMAEAVKTNRQIREENAELRSYVESYRRQMERTKPGEERARTEDINRLAKALLKEHGSGLDSSYLARRLQKLGDYIVSNNGGEGISDQELRRAARQIAKDIAENSTVEIDDNRELRKEIRDYLKDTRLQISDELRGDIADFEDFRRSNFGTLRMAKDGRSCSGDENNETHAKIKNGGIKNERTR